jgi:hypothetical protein
LYARFQGIAKLITKTSGFGVINVALAVIMLQLTMEKGIVPFVELWEDTGLINIVDLELWITVSHEISGIPGINQEAGTNLVMILHPETKLSKKVLQ